MRKKDCFELDKTYRAQYPDAMRGSRLDSGLDEPGIKTFLEQLEKLEYALDVR